MPCDAVHYLEGMDRVAYPLFIYPPCFVADVQYPQHMVSSPLKKSEIDVHSICCCVYLVKMLEMTRWFGELIYIIVPLSNDTSYVV